MQNLLLALRNIGRNRRRSLVTILAVAVSCGGLALFGRRPDDDARRDVGGDGDDHELDALGLEHDVVVDLVHHLEVGDGSVEAGEAVDVLGVDDGAGREGEGHGGILVGGMTQYAKRDAQFAAYGSRERSFSSMRSCLPSAGNARCGQPWRSQTLQPAPIGVAASGSDSASPFA